MYTLASHSIRSIPRVHIGFALAGLALSVLSFIADQVGGCRSCQTQPELSTVISILGILCYASLAILGASHRTKLFAGGVTMAAAIHTALVLWMAASDRWCWICLTAAILAAANLGIMIVRRSADLALVERIFLPCLLLSSGLVFAITIAQSNQESVGQAQMASAGTFQDEADTAGTVQVTVYENRHCEYCETLRDEYLPALRRQFGGALDVRFADSSTAAWVRRTPTIVVQGGPVFEGLPDSVDVLADVIQAALDPSSR